MIDQYVEGDLAIYQPSRCLMQAYQSHLIHSQSHRGPIEINLPVHRRITDRRLLAIIATANPRTEISGRLIHIQIKSTGCIQQQQR